MPDDVWENPALNPTRTWEDSVAVRNELSFIVHGSTPRGRVDFLRQLLEAGELEVSDPQRHEWALFFNKVARAFGFTPMIEFSGETCRLTETVVAPLRKVFSQNYTPGK
ncbi:thioredoxin domain-containing protein [Amycolatopsis thermoflava]|uniref:hypothetical protein n=1 Tax=Amycolatopsis thermoflava TaxID=84480 RepID=UPI003663526C